MKRRLKLSSLESGEECFIEIVLLDNGDFVIGLIGQDMQGTLRYIEAKMKSPFGRGGDEANYKLLRIIYEDMRGRK